MFFKVVCICGIKKKMEPSDLYYVGNVTLLKLFKKDEYNLWGKGEGGKKLYRVKVDVAGWKWIR